MKRAGSSHADSSDIELLLETVHDRFHYDFRGYARSSLERRIGVAQSRLGCESLAELKSLILADSSAFSCLLQSLSVQVSAMFRNPSFYRTLREHIVPILHTYPSLKLWIAGCGGGEEIYSFAILLHEEGLLDRSTIYATDINTEALRKAEAGIYPLDRVLPFAESHLLSGGKSALSQYYKAAKGVATFDPALRKAVVFADHDLATDSVFAEVQVISCRNVLMYFDDRLRDRVMGLFKDSLCRRGFLGIGSKESLFLSSRASVFHEILPPERWYQRRPA